MRHWEWVKNIIPDKLFLLSNKLKIMILKPDEGATFMVLLSKMLVSQKFFLKTLWALMDGLVTKSSNHRPT